VPETRYAKNDGSYVAFQVVGEGPADLVYAGGLVTHVDLQWDFPEAERYLHRLASFSRLILFDRRGTGISDPVALDRLPTWEEWAGDLRAVLDAAGSRRAAIFAERDAGSMALLFAAAHPQRVSALVLANASARFLRADDYPCGEPPEAAAQLHRLILDDWGTERLVAVAIPSHAEDENFLRLAARFQRAAATPHAAAEQYRSFLGTDVRDALAGIRCPTLILHRPRLPLFAAAAHAEYLERHLPGSRRIEIPGADMFFFYEGANDSLGHIEEFLTGTRAQSAADRVLVTVLFADVVGSTRLASEHGDARWRDLAARFQGMLGAQVSRFRGRLVDTAGDGVFAVFDGPTRALECARAIRDEARTLDLGVRVGLHAGECEVSDRAVRGVAVHIGARVIDKARAGEILVSRTVRDLVAGSGLAFERRGKHELKGVPGLWGLYALADPEPA
jgi:class 3 adenylate cyclase/pimeloyl-ACP methyl ester carboxylesterase